MLKGKWITRLAWMAALAAAWTGREARAYLAISGDLETLVNRGSVIVEATVAGGPAGALEVRVTRVLRGEVKTGDVLTIEAGGYRKMGSSGGVEGADGFAAGDQLICFLCDDKPWLTPAKDAKKIYDVVGMRMVADGSVVDFSQEFSGPLVAELGPGFAKRRFALEDFRKRLAEIVQKNDAVMADVRKAAAEKDSAKVLALLRLRPVRQDSMIPGEDLAGAAAVGALNELHDYAVLADAAAWKNGRYEFEKGFYTAEGREFLLRTIGDKKVDVARRLACATMLPYHGVIELPGSVFLRDPHYVARLAQLAADNAGSPELCMQLAGRVGGYRGMGPPEDADVGEGMGILAKLYRGNANESIRWCIENALCSNSPEAYAALQPPGGPMIAIVRAIGGEKNRPVVGRKWTVDIGWEMYFADRNEHTLQTELMLQPVAGGEAISGGAGHAIGSRDMGGSSTQTVVIPATLPAGKYKVYFQFREEGKVVGQSHFAEVEIGRE